VPAEAALDEAVEIAQNVDAVLALLADHRVIPEYCI